MMFFSDFFSENTSKHPKYCDSRLLLNFVCNFPLEMQKVSTFCIAKFRCVREKWLSNSN